MLVAASTVLGQAAPKRLSDWLLEQPYSADAYPLGLSWRVPEEKASQSLLQRDLLQSLSGSGASGGAAGFDREVSADPEAVSRLREWLQTLPVTGRVPVAIADARWLQANPARDPVLQPHHTVVLPARPGSVTVITGKGERCAAAHSYAREAIAYVEACNPEGARRVDWAWIAQPDGRVQKFGIAIWNREKQDEPAPGAWIWAPARDEGWPEIFSERLIRFLATQGPAHHPAPQSGAPLHHSVAPSATPLLREEGKSLQVTASDWGTVGLLQTPSARMAKAGTFNFTFSHVQPYSRGNIFVQPFDWLEAGFRYSDISNRLYDPTGTLNDQSLKDKSFDAKFKLWDESAWLPQVAVGLRDIGGTGLFAGEYVVANKRTDAFDWSLGLGWGNVGARGNLRNPLRRVFGSKFDTRQSATAEGGNLAFGSYFRGPAAFFGGVQYQTPWQPLILKLEYDGNDYQHEPQANNQRVRSPWNFGLVYRGRWVDLSLGVERGNTLMLGLTFFTGLDAMHMPKVNDPPRVPVVTVRPAGTANWAATSEALQRQTDWHVHRIELRGRELHVTVDDAVAQHWRERIDRAAAVLNRDAPASVDRFVLVHRQHGIEVAEHVIDRDAWVAERSRPLPPGERREWVIGRAAQGDAPGSADRERAQPGAEPRFALYEKSQPRFETRLGMDFQQTLGGPDAFALYQFSGALRSILRIRDDTWLRSTFRLALINNYDKFTVTGPSNLPRVRTFLREYLTTSSLTMPLLQLTHMGKLTDNQYYSVYAGYFEEMFGGVGAEWLYRPFASRLAYGVDLNAVRQRNFEQDFGFRDYRTLTGHATAYWDTGWHNVQAKFSVGRYLAKDIGVTVDFSRVFRNGVVVGAFATKTNVSAAQFGEGSFDKGVYLSIPFDTMLTKSSGSTANFLWRPLTRDGGAKLFHPDQLYGLTRLRDDRTLWFAPAPLPNEAAIPSDRREAWSAPPEGPEPYLRVETRPTVAQWNADSRFEHALVQALYQQRFRNIRVGFDSSYRLNVAVSNESVRPISRAVGRATRTALRFAPLETREIRVTFAERIDPVVRYEFVDAARLERYFSGAIERQEIADTIAVEYLNPAVREADPLARLGDLDTLDDTPKLAELLPDTRPVKRVAADVTGAAQAGAGVDWLSASAYGAGMIVGSAALDRRAFQFAKDHGDNRLLKGVTNVGNAVPWLGLGAAALAALDGSDPRRSKTGYAATEAGAVAFLAATGLKYVVGRARPEAGLGNREFKMCATDKDHNAFPSRHTSVAWAVATPFALEYGANWLYGVAALSNLARVGSRAHWVSDTVGGSLLGYTIGRLFWESSRAPAKGVPRVLLDSSGINLAWDLQ